MMKRRFFALFLILSCFLCFFLVKYDFAQQIVEETSEKTDKAEPRSEKITSSPKDIREKTAMYVFLVWMWISIFVLIYILRQKIKEVDRIFRLKFFS